MHYPESPKVSTWSGISGPWAAIVLVIYRVEKVPLKKPDCLIRLVNVYLACSVLTLVNAIPS